MTIVSSVDRTRDLTIFTVEGPLTLDEQMAVLKKFYEGAPTANVLWDFRRATGNRITSTELRRIIAYIKSMEGCRVRGRTALVAATDLDFGLSRMSQVLGGIEKLPWELRAFRSMTEALAWIDDGMLSERDD
jgi:hypothetical protein